MKFPEKLWWIVDECTSGAISWGEEGDEILIEFGKFKNEFLGQYKGFKTKNVVSFVRQLNLYGFRKCNKVGHVHAFKHQYFIRGRRDLLIFVRRSHGYSDYSITPEKFENKENLATLQKQVPRNSRDGYSEKISQAGPSSCSSIPLPQLKDLNSYDSSKHSWGNNPYYPMDSMYYSMSSGLSNGANCIPISSKKEFNNDVVKEENSSYWENLGMYNNVVFVPVPASCGLHPGMFNGNLGMKFGIPFQPYHSIGDLTSAQEPEDNVLANCTTELSLTKPRTLFETK